MPPQNPSTVLMRDIVKRFPRVVANDRVTFEARAGEIHALLGENGAGKTTLMNILYGIYRPDAGEIFIKGKPVVIHSPRDALRLGIGMVHQNFRLVPTHTVAENVILGMPGAPIVDQRVLRTQVETFSQKYGLHVDPTACIWQLAAGEQQRVEIVKALYRGADILILDEPTSMLTPGETRDLMTTLRRMAAEGHTIIFITHKMDEVIALSQRVTVLRQGKVIATLETTQTDERALARLMVGREVLFQLTKAPTQRPASDAQGERAHPATPVLRVENLHVLNDKGLPAVKNLSFILNTGEILGIAGVAGNGQRELVEALAGLRPLTRGEIFVAGQKVSTPSPRTMDVHGVAFVPGERWTGLVPGMSIAENLILKNYRRAPFSTGGWLNRAAIHAHADHLIEQYAITPTDRATPLKLLSGGNIQRVLLARETSGTPRVLIAAHPTSGLDVGATEFIRQLLLTQRAQGRAVLLVSEDLEEILTLSDRVAVMFAGEIMGILPTEQAELETLGLMMAGAKRVEVV